MSHSRRAMLVLLVLCAAAHRDALAAWPVDPSANVRVTGVRSVERNLSASSDADSGAFVVWETGLQVYVQHVLGDGAIDPAWPSDGAPVSDNGSPQVFPRATSDGNGGAFVAWFDYHGPDYWVYVQHLNSSGQIADGWPSIGVGLGSARYGYNAGVRLATLGDGDVLVAWRDYQEERGYVQYVQGLLANGQRTPADEPAALDLGASSYESPTDLMTDEAGGAYMVWKSVAGAPRALRFDSDARRNVSWPAEGLELQPWGGANMDPVLAPDDAGGFLVAWCPDGGAILLQHVLPAGLIDPSWPSGGLLVNRRLATVARPRIASDGVGGAFVGWSDYRSGTEDLYVTHALPSGALDSNWPAIGTPLCLLAGIRGGLSLVPAGSGGVFATWSDGRDASDANIYGVRLSSAGEVLGDWDRSGNLVCVAQGPQGATSLMPSGANGAIVAWQDWRFTPPSGYAQRIVDLGGMGRPSPRIVSVADVPNDQGQVVKLRWENTYLEGVRGPTAVTEYWVLREVPDRGLAGASSMAKSGQSVQASGSPLLQHELGSYWEVVSRQAAFHQPGYSYVAATTSDSLPGSNPYTKFMIMARNADGSQYYFSAPDSGYSVDNLSPPTPSPFTARYDGSSVALHWTPSRVADFKEYRVYRGPTVSFVPGPQYLVSATPDTGFVDHPPLGAGDVYKLVAVDIHGNASKFAVVTPSSPVSALAALVSADWQDDAAQLVWYGGALALTEVTVLREEDGAGWTEIATVTGDGEGMVRFADAAVLPGHRYGYKLRFNESGVERFAGEAYIAIPAGRLAIQAVAPNPVMSNRLRLRASLAQTGPARVRVLDLAGRIVRDQEAPTNLTGAFEMSLDGGEPLRPGVYIVELRQGSARATTRFTYLR